MRIHHIANALDIDRDGSVHAADHRIWDSGRSCRWSGALPHVQAGNSRCRPSEVPSADHDPLYRFHQWQANLRVLDVNEIKTVPYVPLSHPFIERLLGTVRRECLDWSLFWTATD